MIKSIINAVVSSAIKAQYVAIQGIAVAYDVCNDTNKGSETLHQILNERTPFCVFSTQEMCDAIVMSDNPAVAYVNIVRSNIGKVRAHMSA